MSDEQRVQIEAFMQDVSKLDEQSFIQIQFAASVLLARERQVTISKERTVGCEVDNIGQEVIHTLN